MQEKVNCIMKGEDLITFIWKQKQNRRYLLWALALAVAQFIIFKLFYPFPDCFQDSNWYIFAANHNLDINIWPIGYSKFLAVFHWLSHSSLALVAFQFFFLELAAFYFYFTLLYLFHPGGLMRIALFVVLFLNPLSLYLANTVASDTIFGALTLLWLSELMWIMERPRVHQLFTQAILIFCCYTLRNTTYYYPIIAALAFLLSKQVWWRKATGIALPFVFVTPFILHTRNVAYTITGSYQSSLLSGWQLGNNALYIYNHITVDSTEFPTPEAREINRMAIQFFRTVDLNKYYQSFDANIYIVKNPSPIREYWQKHGNHFKGPYAAAANWGRASAAIEPFGKSIILHHPWGYLRYFALANIENYLFPPLCDIRFFHNNMTRAFPEERAWFDYKSDKVSCSSYTFQGNLEIYSYVFLLLNGFFLAGLLWVAMEGRSIKFENTDRRLLLLFSAYLFINFLFTISASVNLLRYQYIPMFMLFTTISIISERTYIAFYRKKMPAFS